MKTVHSGSIATLHGCKDNSWVEIWSRKYDFKNDSNEDNLALIITVRNALPELIAEIEILRTVRDAVCKERKDAEIERDAALARAEKAEAEVNRLKKMQSTIEPCDDCWTMIAIARAMGFETFENFYTEVIPAIEALKARAEQMQAERDWIAKSLTISVGSMEAILEQAAQRTTKRGEEV